MFIAFVFHVQERGEGGFLLVHIEASAEDENPVSAVIFLSLQFLTMIMNDDFK